MQRQGSASFWVGVLGTEVNRDVTRMASLGAGLPWMRVHIHQFQGDQAVQSDDQP